jgi:hypothetical protein
MDTELAIQELDEYLALLQRGLAIVVRSADEIGYVRDTQFQQVMTELNARTLLIERIINEVDEILAAQFKNQPNRGWSRASEIVPVEKALGLLRRRDEEGAIFGLSGPKLVATNMHPWIWNSAVSLWHSGHFADAVRRASMDLFDVHLPQKLGIPKQGSPDDRITKAFSTNSPTANEPRLRFVGLTFGTPDWTSAHEGAMFFGKGCAKGIRNVTAHGSNPDEPLALEALAGLSLLARWIDEAEVDNLE